MTVDDGSPQLIDDDPTSRLQGFSVKSHANFFPKMFEINMTLRGFPIKCQCTLDSAGFQKIFSFIIDGTLGRLAGLPLGGLPPPRHLLTYSTLLGSERGLRRGS
jgi:hypothetical protein